GWGSESPCTCVGGPSVFYGGASFRFREGDFAPPAEVVGDSGAEWPVDYAELEPFYTQAERLLGVAGQTGEDPTEPPRSAPYPHPPARLSATAARMGAAAKALGLHPFRIPLALNAVAGEQAACAACTTCDAFACAIGAKNDLATRLIPRLVAAGMELRPETVALRLVAEGDRVTAVECFDKRRGERIVFHGDAFVLAAGAIATPHLLLASGLERRSPAADAVGRYLMRHCNAMTYGLFLRRPNRANEHHKQLALTDFYFGAPDDPAAPAGKLGSLQQVMPPAAGLVLHVVPKRVAGLLKPLVRHLPGAAGLVTRHFTGLLAIAEDQPRPENAVRLDPAERDPYGVPRAVVEHHYTPRDLAARAALVRRAEAVLRRAGAAACFSWKVSTFSHAVGTVRMGPDERTAPLDADGRFRGLENLYVTDGSALPTSAGVNPSLTIAANALRVGRRLAGVPAEAAAAAAGGAA
ncbi:MAG TPA: GMC family oxidoreductase, partial [Longimicrobiaceae bacterium]|nr:GMC family oxidoreductase [Longimicrobiaceae bacterium]